MKQLQPPPNQSITKQLLLNQQQHYVQPGDRQDRSHRDRSERNHYNKNEQMDKFKGSPFLNYIFMSNDMSKTPEGTQKLALQSSSIQNAQLLHNIQNQKKNSARNKQDENQKAAPDDTCATRTTIMFEHRDLKSTCFPLSSFPDVKLSSCLAFPLSSFPAV